MTDPRETGRSPIQAIDRAVGMLDHLSQVGAVGSSLTDTARAVGLHISTTRTLLSALTMHGFVDQDERTRVYRLGARFFELGRVYTTHSDLASVAAPVINELWKQTQETIHLSVLQGVVRVDIAVLVSPQILNVNPSISHPMRVDPLSLRRTAAGKVLLAGLPDEISDEILKSSGADAVEQERTRATLNIVRRKGFATNFDEEAAGVCGVAAAVTAPGGQWIGALCIGYPTARRASTYDAKLRDAVLSSANVVSGLLGAGASKS